MTTFEEEHKRRINEMAERAGAVLEFFSHRYDPDDMLDWDETLTDLLSDLRHWCNREGLDFDEIVEKSQDNYTNEVTPDDIFADVIKSAVKEADQKE